MIALGIMAIMVIILIYFVVINQGLRRQIRIARNASSHHLRTVKNVEKQLAYTAAELQRIFLARIDEQNNHGLMAENDYRIVHFILKHCQAIVMHCVERNSSIEEALKKVLKSQSITQTDINDFIKQQPNDIKIAWCRNTVDGFIAACRGLSTGNLNTTAADKAELTSTEATTSEQ